MDISTSRTQTLIENFFGEPIQLHQKYLLKDVSWDRPIFVEYSWIVNYVIEALIVLLFCNGNCCRLALQIYENAFVMVCFRFYIAYYNWVLPSTKYI